MKLSSLASIWKQIGNYNPADGTPPAETSIIVDQNGVINGGKPFTITFQCGDENTWPPVGANTPTLVIRDYFSRAILRTVVWPNGGYRGFAVNQTINGLVHIFGTQDPSNQKNANAFVHSTIDATFTPSTAVVIMQARLYGGAQDIAGYVTPNAQGGWSLNYANPNGAGFLDWPDANFTPEEVSASNPNGWTNFISGQAWNALTETCAAEYNAADGYWYSLVQNLRYNPIMYYVTMARSIDRLHWTYSPTIFLYPDMPQLEGVDNSDVRMVEYQGQIYIVHLCGDQSTWSNVRTATFQGTLAQLRGQFF